MDQTFAGQLFNAISWTLIHSLWQAVLLTILIGLVVFTTKRSSPSYRYAMLVILLFCFIGTTLATFIYEWQSNLDNSAAGDASSTVLTVQHAITQYNWWNNLTGFLNEYSAWIVPAWAIIVFLKLVRMLIDFMYVHRLRTTYISTPDETWVTRLQQLSREIGIQKQVTLLESQLVNIPVVAGHFRPIILVPLGILSRLSPEQMEAVLLHELAHIRRHDYLINLLQRVASIVFFFNPGVLWLTSLIRAERENCCDDIAIAHTNNKLEFVEALISVKQHSLSAPTLAMNFLGRKNLLLHRMNRIIHSRNKSLSFGELFFFALSLLGAFLLFSSSQNGIGTELKTYVSAAPIHSSLHLSTVYRDRVLMKDTVRNNSHQERPLEVTNHIRLRNEPTRTNISSRHAEKDKQMVIVKIVEPEQEVPLYNQSSYEKQVPSAELERLQAEKDRKAAERDRIQADKDRAQAELDRKQAEKDREQAKKDRAQAELDRKQAEKDRVQADRDYAQAIRDRLLVNAKKMTQVN